MALAQEATYDVLKKNNRKSAQVLFDRYGKRLCSYAIRNWHCDEDTAWDMVYKCLLKVREVHAKYSFESEKKFSAFILQIFLNLLRNHYRAQKDIRFFPLDHPELATAQEEEPENVSPLMKMLQDELEQLEDWEKILLLLRAQGMPYSEIANYVDRPVNQLKVYYQRLKNKLENRITARKEVEHGNK